MLTELTQKIISLTLKNKYEDLDKELNTLNYAELSLLYTMCLNLSKHIRLVSAFNSPPYKEKKT